MKKFSIVATMAIAAASFTACGPSTPSADLETDVDTLSYTLGMAQTQGLKDYLAMQMDVDTAYMNDFIKGVLEGADAGEDQKKGAYIAGIMIGKQLAGNLPRMNYQFFGEDSTMTVSLQNLMAGFVGALKNDGEFKLQQADSIANAKIREFQVRKVEKLYADNKEAGEQWLADNAKKEGVVTLPSGVQYKILKAGKGAIPADSTVVKLHYEGKLIDGTVFDSSYKRKTPMTGPCNRNIKGFSEALTHMPVGSTWEVYIPQELAYGANQQGGNIKPFSALIFKIELLSIEK